MRSLIGFPRWFIILTVVIPRSYGASFDCSKANSRTEKIICSDPALGKLDSEMGSTYKARQDSLPVDKGSQLKTLQKSWIRNRDHVCERSAKTNECLKDYIARRRDELSAPVASSLGAPSRANFGEEGSSTILKRHAFPYFFLELDLPDNVRIKKKRNVVSLESPIGTILELKRKPLSGLRLDLGKIGIYQYNAKTNTWIVTGGGCDIRDLNPGVNGIKNSNPPIKTVHYGNLMAEGYPRKNIIVTSKGYAIIIDQSIDDSEGAKEGLNELQDLILSTLRFIGNAKALEPQCKTTDSNSE